jgi:ATP-dependent Clp protease ATP-binding subunit ClpC
MLASARPGVPVSLVPQPRARAAKLEPTTTAGIGAAPPAPSTPPPALEASSRSRVLERDRFPLLAAFGKNLSAAAAEGRFDPVVGRDDEIDELLDVLAKRHTNSACLVGPPGVGKTSVVRGLAQRLVEEDDPRIVVELVASELVAGTGTRGALAERIASIIAEVGKSDRDVVLFFDEMHELFGGALDEATAELKRALGKGDVVVIGATTAEELKKVADADATLARRFTVLEIEEPDVADAFFVVKGAAVALGRHHRLAYADEAVASAVDWSIRYLPGRALPDKAIALLDLAGARLRRRGGASTVAPKDVAQVAAEVADVPVERLLETDHERMLNLEALLADRVVGHVPELARIARVLRRNAAGLRGRRPIGSFLLLGPTGVGKTETAKAIAEALFHSQDAMTRLDFSEYAEAHAVARLVGAPPGYVGHDAGGQLTEAVRRRPYQVVLLDEIEKAHRDVLEAFLQVLDEGRLTDGRGRRVDLTNVVIVMTSNLGAAEAGAARAERTVGFGRTQGVAPGRLAEVMVGAARQHLPPELYNRIDEVLCFGPLTRPEVAEIARRQLGELEERLAARGVGLDVDDDVVEALLASGGFDVELGARPLRRTLGRLVENPLAELILKGELGEGAVALVGVDGGEIVVDAVPAGAREHAAS